MTSPPAMAGQTVLITGATAGIGRATARALSAQGARVLLVGRDPGRSEDAARALRAAAPGAQVDVYQADLASLASVRRLARQVGEALPHLDVLINNAGGVNQTRRLSEDGLELTLAVNHLAPFLLTLELLPLLRQSPSARIVNVSSSAQARGHIDFADLQGERRYAPMQAYFQSKLANVLFTYELHRRLGGRGPSVNALHPGVVNSNFGSEARGLLGLGMTLIKRLGAVSPEDGARTSVYLASSPEVEGISGRYFEGRRAVPSGRESYDQAVAGRLWQVSEELTGWTGSLA